MQKIIMLLSALLLLSGCVHKMNIEQGNIIEQDSINKLHKGMSQEEVRSLLGSPVLINTFRDNRVDYVYTNKPGYGKGTEKNITLIFQGDRLKEISPLIEQEFGK
jgi:outer membrane protein assembly factor BamE